MEERDTTAALARRLAARGVELVRLEDGDIEAECRACRLRWPIPTARVEAPEEDAAADWWWCPNGCNREE